MDVSALSLKIDSNDVVKATGDLDKFAASADRAAASTGKLSGSGSTAKLAQDYQRTARTANQASGSIARIAETVTRADAAMRSASTAAAAMSVANDNVARSTMNADSHVIAYRNNLERLATANKSTGAASSAAATQVASVGVATKATSALVSGLMGILGGLVGAIIGSLIGAILEWVASLWEADKALDAVAVGADNLGSAQAALGKMFDLSTGKIKNNTQALRDNIYTQMKAFEASAITNRQKASSQLLDAGLGQTTALGRFGTRLLGIGGRRDQVENKIAQQEAQGRRFESLLTGLSQGALNREEAGRIIDSMAGLTDAQRRQLQNAATSAYDSGTAAQAARDLQSGLNGKLPPGYLTTGGASSSSGRGAGSRGKSDAEKTADLVRNAEAAIAAEQNRSKAVEMSALATAELEQKTKLLNAAASAGLKITPALSAEIDRLSASYAKAKVDADVSEVVQHVTDDIQKQRDALADQNKLIGLYGDALARATREMEAQKKIRDALPKGEIVVTGNITGGLSDDIEAQNQVKRIEAIRRERELSDFALQREAGSIALAGEEVIKYNFVTEKMLELKRAGIEASPAEIAAIDAAADAYARQRYAIDQQKQAVADAREVTKGFYTDLIGGLRHGENAFKAFADAAVNALNRIIDKLLDRALDGFLNSMFSSGSGGGFLGSLFGGGGSGGSSSLVQPKGMNSWDVIKSGKNFALGGAFDRAQRFANGGAFTNSIVTSPTFFKFANGSKFGEMGEAGPEAVMPLSRGSNGKLGVQMHGGGGGRRADIKIENTYQFAGAVGIDGIVSLIRQGGAETYNQVKRDLQSLLQQLDIDGTVTS